jgi:predicted translin family RNA/ssDNA-binding protein
MEKKNNFSKVDPKSTSDIKTTSDMKKSIIIVKNTPVDPKKAIIPVKKSIVDPNQFAAIRQTIETYDDLREQLIKRSRDVLKTAKLLSYSIHRDDNVEQTFTKLMADKKSMDEFVKKDKTLIFEGSYSDACQEYVEAVSFYYFTKGRFVYPAELQVTEEDYLMGLCDLTGELARRAVMNHSNKEVVKRIHQYVDEIYYEFLKFSFRNGKIRQKSDSLKWNLKKIEELLYEK